MKVLDYMYRADAKALAAFKANGASGVARYLDPYNPKGVTAEEVADIFAAGLELHLFYETTGGSIRPDLYFTHAQGATDCSAADDLLHGLGAPEGTVVYFAVDVNVEPSLVTEYANGIEAAATPQITPGLYGYQRMCEYAYANYPNIGKHLAQTYGTPTVPLEMWQHEQTDIAGVTVDVNDVYVPGWKGTDMTETAQETYDRIAPLLQDKIVAPQENTNTALKAALAALQSPSAISDAQLKKIATVLGLMLQAEGAK